MLDNALLCSQISVIGRPTHSHGLGKGSLLQTFHGVRGRGDRDESTHHFEVVESWALVDTDRIAAHHS